MPFGIPDEHVGAAAGAAQRALGDGEVVAHQIELGVTGFGKQDLVGIRDRDLAAGNRDDFAPLHHSITSSETA